MNLAQKIVEMKPFQFIWNGKKWSVSFDKTIDRSYAHYFEYRIVLKNPIDFIHELLHVVMHEQS